MNKSEVKIVVVLLVAAFAGQVSGDIERCVKNKIIECNNSVKKAFERADKSTLNLNQYCTAMKALSDCVTTQVKSPSNLLCSTNLMKKYNLIVLSYLKMNKVTAVCPETDLTAMKNLVVPDLEMSSVLSEDGYDKVRNFINLVIKVDSPVIKACGKRVHEFCTQAFTGSEKSSTDLCTGVTNFVTCYETQTQVCKDPISVAFSQVVAKMSRFLVYTFRLSNMCEVRNVEL